jgi:hypothetical protein
LCHVIILNNLGLLKYFADVLRNTVWPSMKVKL